MTPFKSFESSDSARLPDFHGYHVLVADSSYPDGHRRDFFNPNSFQLVANGLDGLPEGPVLKNGNYSDAHAKNHVLHRFTDYSVILEKPR